MIILIYLGFTFFIIFLGWFFSLFGGEPFDWEDATTILGISLALGFLVFGVAILGGGFVGYWGMPWIMWG